MRHCRCGSSHHFGAVHRRIGPSCLLCHEKKSSALVYPCKDELEYRKKVCAFGFSAFVNNASNSIIGIVFNLRLMALTGSDGVVTYGVVMYINYIISGVFFGYSNGIAPVFSYNLGAQNTEEIKGLFRKSIAFLASSALVLATLFILCAKPLAAVFVNYSDDLMS